MTTATFPMFRYRRHARRALTVALGIALAGSWPAATMGRVDPFLAAVATMPAAERITLAREYGFQPELSLGDAIPVTNCDDDGPGSLRDAVASAATGAIVDARGLGCDRIVLSHEITIAVDDLEIIGDGPSALSIVNGAASGRVITHTGHGALELFGLDLSSGYVAPASGRALGGCLYSSGGLALGDEFDAGNAAKGVTVHDCKAVASAADQFAFGGGIYAEDGISLVQSTVTGCVAEIIGDAREAAGGGLHAGGAGFVAKYSEISDNAALGSFGVAGGVDAGFVDQIFISHSTIAGNIATSKGGGGYLGTISGNTLSIDNTTISGNTASGSSGLELNVLSGSTPGSIVIASSTFVGNVATGDITPAALAVNGPIELDSTLISANGVDFYQLDADWPVSGADNLIGVHIGDVPSDGLVVSSDPHVGPLAHNGGATRTHALLSGSPAIDAGNDAFHSSTDQRGQPRTAGPASDIGAYERDVLFADGFER